MPRHEPLDRLVHWLMAAAMLTLLASALLPQYGVKFEWVTLHWVTGLVLVVLTLAHLARVAVRRSWSAMRAGGGEMRTYLVAILGELAGRTTELDQAGKYALPQKLFHHAIAAVVLLGAATGIALMVRIDSPFWERDPYWLSAATWGTIYVLHDLAALLTITALVLHLYFAARPEKRHYTRAMLFGGSGIPEEENR